MHDGGLGCGRSAPCARTPGGTPRWTPAKPRPSITFFGDCSGEPAQPVPRSATLASPRRPSCRPATPAWTRAAGLGPERIALPLGHLIESRQLSSLPAIDPADPAPGIISPIGLLDGIATLAEAAKQLGEYAYWIRGLADAGTNLRVLFRTARGSTVPAAPRHPTLRSQRQGHNQIGHTLLDPGGSAQGRRHSTKISRTAGPVNPAALTGL